MTELIFLAGLLLSQALSTPDHQADALPAGVLDVHGHPHLLSFEEQSPVDAMASVEAALMMHARDASRYGLVEPASLSSSSDGLHQLQVSERGSAGDLQIHFSIASTDSTTTDTQKQFSHFEVFVRGKRLDAKHYAQILAELQRGYVSSGEPTTSSLPKLPKMPLSPGSMI